MYVRRLVLAVLATTATASPTNIAARASCTFTDAATAIKQKGTCSTINLSNIVVPAGQTLDLTGLKDQTQVRSQHFLIFHFNDLTT